MAVLVFTRRAEADLDGIAEYTLRTWGIEQATRYLDTLQDCRHLIANNPSLGRASDEILVGCRRFEVAKHVIFFRPLGDGVRVLRILHQRMLPERHLGDEAAE